MHEHIDHIGMFQLLRIMQAEKNIIPKSEGNVPFAVGKDTPIIAYCAAGVRAQSAVDMLVQEAQPALEEIEEITTVWLTCMTQWLVPEGYTDVMNGGGYSSQLEKVCQACAATTTSHFAWIWRSVRFLRGSKSLLLPDGLGQYWKVTDTEASRTGWFAVALGVGRQKQKTPVRSQVTGCGNPKR